MKSYTVFLCLTYFTSWCPLGPSVLSQMAKFHFSLWFSNIPSYVCVCVCISHLLYPFPFIPFYYYWTPIIDLLCTCHLGIPWSMRVIQHLIGPLIETQAWFLCWEDPLEKEMAPQPSILAWRIPWTREPGRLYVVHGVAKSWTWLSN